MAQLFHNTPAFQDTERALKDRADTGNLCPSTTCAATDPFECHQERAEESYPEGGHEAWLVVLGAWCAMIPSMGLLNSIGVLQAWISENQLSSHSEATVGWIFSIYAFLLLFGGAQIGEYISRQYFFLAD